MYCGTPGRESYVAYGAAAAVALESPLIAGTAPRAGGVPSPPDGGARASERERERKTH